MLKLLLALSCLGLIAVTYVVPGDDGRVPTLSSEQGAR